MVEKEIIIDAEHALLGRLASFVAKKLLLGSKVVIVNCEKVIVSGNRKFALANYRRKIARGGDAQKGPYFPKTPEKIVIRTIRGMLPYKKKRGMDAYRSLRCYKDIPEKYKNSKMIKGKREVKVYVILSDLCKLL